MDTTKTTRTPGAAWVVAAVILVLGAVGTGLAAALGVHGFARGMLLGAALACLLLGGMLLGGAYSRHRQRPNTDWLPSRDGDR